jgi:hypothetical protein
MKKFGTPGRAGPGYAKLNVGFAAVGTPPLPAIGAVLDTVVVEPDACVRCCPARPGVAACELGFSSRAVPLGRGGAGALADEDVEVEVEVVVVVVVELDDAD